MSKKKPAKPSPSHLLSQLVHIRAEIDDLIREAEQQAGYTIKHDDWKARCKIVRRADGYWDVVSPDGGWCWEGGFCGWRTFGSAQVGAGWYLTANSARRALAACTVPPPGEGGR